jgi:hypothetical protein
MGAAQIRLDHWAWAVAFALAYFALAAASLEMAQGANGIAFVWPSSGISVAAVMLLAAARRTAFLIRGGVYGREYR